MIDKFWEGFSGKLSEQWAARILSPALVFWAGGLLLWASRDPAGMVPALAGWGAGLARVPAVAQVGLAAAALIAVAGSAALAEQVTLPVLRLLEGYWPAWPAAPLARRRARRLREARARAQRFAGAGGEGGTADELGRLQALLRRHPAPGRELPTRLGNLVRAAEERPGERYGLDAVVCWPYLWLVLDDTTRTEVATARAGLNGAARMWLWSVAFALWTPLSWWAVPVALTGAAISYFLLALSAAQTYGSLVEAAFALHRHRLYEALRWPPPEKPGEEPARGQEITLYLLRGIPPEGLTFREAQP